MSLRMDFESLEDSKPTQDHSSSLTYLLGLFDPFCDLTKKVYGETFDIEVLSKLHRFVSFAAGDKVDGALVQGFIDSLDDNYDEESTGVFISALLARCPESELVLDFTGKNIPSYLGCCLENKTLQLLGSGKAEYLGEAAKNCKFTADFAFSNPGSLSKDCEFTAPEIHIGWPVGAETSNCRFYSGTPFEPEDIAREQDGTSQYFVNNVEVAYEHHVDGDSSKELIRHEP